MRSFKKIIFIFLSVIMTTTAVYGRMDARRAQLIEIIDEELKEVIRLNRQVGAKKPKLLLRMAELYLEKARLINEEENFRWISLTPEESDKLDQKDFFKTSRKYFLTAQKTCYFILKRFKNFKEKGDVYYILAYNAKEFQQPDRAKKFFQRALRYSPANSYTSIKTKLALGEIYYNEKKYKEAIPLYETALKDTTQKWWTKDAYNLAWCYFRIDKRTKAIQLMERVHAKSSDASYVNVSSQVERDLAYFYSASGRTQDAMGFYKKIGKDIGANLLKVGKYLKSQGKFSAAEKTLEEAKANTKNQDSINEINVELLSLYERYGKTIKHLAVAKELYQAHLKSRLNEKQLEDLKYHVAKMSSHLQKQVVSKTYRKQKSVRNQKAALATEYFKIQGLLTGASANHKSTFHAAETKYAINDFDGSAQLYDIAFDAAMAAKDKKIAKLSLDGLMASLGGRGVSKATTDKYLSKAYSIYLQSNPRSKRSFKIYQRLFNQKMDAKDILGAEQVLLKFKVHFPKAISKQEVMLAQIMDYHKENNNRKRISLWVNKINEGEFKVSKKFANKLRLILLSIQFDKVEKFNTKGDKVAALKGYLEIYKSPESSSDAKKNAAYNIAILFHELGNREQTYGWAKRAMSLMDISDIKKYEDSFLLIATGLFNYREFKKSADIYELTLEKVCKKKSKNKDIFYRNANIIYLAEGNTEKSLEMVTTGRNCAISYNVRQEGELDLLKELAEQERWSEFQDILASVKRNNRNAAAIIYPMVQLRDALFSRGRRDEALKINREILQSYNKAKSQSQNIPLEALDVVAENYIESLKRAAQELEQVKLIFPEKTYNALLQKKFKLLDNVTSKALSLFKVGSGEGIVQGYRILVQAYETMGQEVLGFTPPGKGEQYVSSFKKSMKDIGEPILRKSREFMQEARKQIRSSKILSRTNYYFFNKLNAPIMPEFYPLKSGVLMDRGGRQ